jgi:hypothetical protein
MTRSVDLLAAEQRRVAFDAAVSAIRKSVPDLTGLASNLEFAGVSSRLVAALRAVPVVEIRIVNSTEPDPDVWRAQCEKLLGERRYDDIPDNIRAALYEVAARGLLPSHPDALLDRVERWERWINGPPLSSSGRVLAFALLNLADDRRRQVIERIIELRV